MTQNTGYVKLKIMQIIGVDESMGRRRGINSYSRKKFRVKKREEILSVL